MQLKQYDLKVLGFALSTEGPANIEDFVRLTGDPNVAQEAIMQIYHYHVKGPAFRKLFAEKLFEFTSEPRKGTEVEGGKPTETEQNYLNRLIADEKITEADAQRIAFEVNEELGAYSPTAGRSSKPAKPYYDKADYYLAQIAAGKSTKENLQANLEAKLGQPFEAAFGEFNRDNFARAIKELDERARKAAMEL